MIEPVEYEIVFNGAHGNSDRDLLDKTLIVGEKRLAAPAAPPPKNRALVIAALHRCPRCTQKALAQMTKLSHASIYDQLYLLRLNGHLGEAETGKRLSGGRIERVYWLTQAVTVRGEAG